MLLIVGLGNPGKEYEKTHHNMGFMVLDKFAESENVKISKTKGKALIFEGNILGEKVVLAKPQTYMNLSGEAVVDLKNKYKPDKILVVYDDIDVEVGSVRFRNSGSGGTHNGMRNIIALLGTNDFARIRVGIKPDLKPNDLASYVLSKLNKSKEQEYESAFQKAIDLIKQFVINKGNLENSSK